MVFPAVAASAPCVALLKSGTGSVRFYQFGSAPEDVVKPYAVWQRIFGAPENYLGQRPDIDSFSLQIDTYATSADQARTIAAALRDALEPIGYITNWLGESKEPETKTYRFAFQMDVWTPR